MPTLMVPALRRLSNCEVPPLLLALVQADTRAGTPMTAAPSTAERLKKSRRVTSPAGIGVDPSSFRRAVSYGCYQSLPKELRPLIRSGQTGLCQTVTYGHHDRVTMTRADDLHSDRQAGGRESARDTCGGLLCHVERVGV